MHPQSSKTNSTCHWCGKPTLKRPWDLTHGRGRYCSKACRLHPLNRFWNRVQPDPETGCWNWTGPKHKSGYGVFQPIIHVTGYLAHRFSYQLSVGLIPVGHDLHHTCRNRACVNPDHLQVLAHNQHSKLECPWAAESKAITHCLRGHPLSGENIYVYDGHRRCKACLAIRKQGYRAAARAARGNR